MEAALNQSFKKIQFSLVAGAGALNLGGISAGWRGERFSRF